MPDKLSIDFTQEELVGIYFIAQTGIISSVLDELIKSVTLKDENKKTDYREAHLDYKEMLMSIREMGGVKAGIDKLEEIRKTIIASMPEDASA